MKAKEIFFEFLETVLISLMIVVIIFYFVLGEHMEVAVMIVKAAVPLALFGLIFIIKFRLVRKKIERQGTTIDLDEVVAYLSLFDKTKDAIVIFLLSILIAILPLGDNSWVIVDLIQAIVFLAINGFWHILLFRCQEKGEVIAITRFNQLKDEVVVFFAPVAMLIVSLFAGDTSWLDTIQAAVAGGGMYFWHRHLFNQR